MEHLNFLAAAFSGAEFLLAELRHSNARNEYTEQKSIAAKKTIDFIKEKLKTNNYTAHMVVGYFNEEPKVIKSHPIYELGETYFNLPEGLIAFVYNNNPLSDKTFYIKRQSAQVIAGRYESDAYQYLVEEINETVNSMESIEG